MQSQPTYVGAWPIAYRAHALRMHSPAACGMQARFTNLSSGIAAYAYVSAWPLRAHAPPPHSEAY